jgi:hypothetical protein
MKSGVTDCTVNDPYSRFTIDDSRSSYPLRPCFVLASGWLRLPPEAIPKRSRSGPEAFPNNSRSGVEHHPNKPEQLPNNSRTVPNKFTDFPKASRSAPEQRGCFSEQLPNKLPFFPNKWGHFPNKSVKRDLKGQNATTDLEGALLCVLCASA